MEIIFSWMMLLGAFGFMGFGFSTNSIEAQENKKVGNILTFLTVLGLISFLIGLIGVLWQN